MQKTNSGPEQGQSTPDTKCGAPEHVQSVLVPFLRLGVVGQDALRCRCLAEEKKKAYAPAPLFSSLSPTYALSFPSRRPLFWSPPRE